MVNLKGAKGVNIIVAVGIIAIFIASFYIMFVFDKLILSNFACIMHTHGQCTGDMFNKVTSGLFIIFGLLVMIAAAVYVMFISIHVDREYKYRQGKV